MTLHEDPVPRLACVLRTGLPTGPEDGLCCLLQELAPHARRRPDETAPRRHLYERQIALYCRVLEAGTDAGAFVLRSPSSEIAANLVALEDAYGYHVIARTSMSRVQAERHLFGYAALTFGLPRLLAAGQR